MPSYGGPSPICSKSCPPWWNSDPPGSGFPLPGLHDFGTLCPEVVQANGILVVPPGQRYNIHIGGNNVLFEEVTTMRIVLKILAAPFVLALTLAVAVLAFITCLASWALNILCLLCGVCGVFELFIQGNTSGGITALVLAFIVSPFGLPALAEWMIVKLDDLNYSLKCFITG